MRIKIGCKWKKPLPGQPLMIEISEEDRRNLTEFLRDPKFTRYAIFADGEPMTAAERERWMKEGTDDNEKP